MQQSSLTAEVSVVHGGIQVLHDVRTLAEQETDGADDLKNPVQPANPAPSINLSFMRVNVVSVQLVDRMP